MLLLAKAFWEIALWRRTPADLPASRFLLGLVACAAALVELFGALLPPTTLHGIVLRIAFVICVPLGFAWLVLALGRQRPRYLQTATALLGVATLAQLVTYPLDSLIDALGPEQLVAIPVGVLVLIAFVWYLVVCANIWRIALDSSLVLGAAISAGYLLLTLLLQEQFLPTA